jgi:putative methyltransferase (TIGR04325 family)
MRNLIRRIKDMPAVLALRKRRYERAFSSRVVGNAFNGVYPDFATATAAIRPDRQIGYDHEGPAAMYRERAQQVYPSDYPVLYWMRRILEPGSSVFDLGGHVGVSFYAYERYLGYPEGLHWTVSDVPSVTQAGVELAKENGRSELSFTNDPSDANGFDVLLASGVLQYLEPRLDDILGSLSEKPRHLILNLTPLHAEHDFVTLNNIGHSICPYRVQCRSRLVDRIVALGYEVVDAWTNADRRCTIPYYEDHGVSAYSGFYFRSPGPSIG